jgi:hypothetical protein
MALLPRERWAYWCSAWTELIDLFTGKELSVRALENALSAGAWTRGSVKKLLSVATDKHHWRDDVQTIYRHARDLDLFHLYHHLSSIRPTGT